MKIYIVTAEQMSVKLHLMQHDQMIQINSA